MIEKAPLFFEARLGMLSPELLRQVLVYNDQDGSFMWLPRPTAMFQASSGKIVRGAEWSANKWNARYANKPALTKRLPGGYLGGSLLNIPVRAHRVAWAIYWGTWPEGEVDHINGKPDDNRIHNLRDVSHSANMKNQKRYGSNVSGVTGVSWYNANQRWIAEIQHDGQKHHLGSFISFDEAVEARRDAEQKFGFHPNHGVSR